MDQQYQPVLRAFHALIQDSCERLAGTTIPNREWTSVEHSRNVTSFTSTSRPDFEGRVPVNAVSDEALDNLLAAFDPHRNLLASILQYSSANDLPSGGQERNRARIFLVRPVLAAYVLEVQSYAYNADVLDRILDRLMIDLTSHTVVVRHTSPLIRLRLAEDVLSLGNKVQLKRLDPQQFERWLNNYAVGPLMLAQRVTPDDLPCLLEVEFERDRVEQWQPGNLPAQVQAWHERDYATLAIRLLTGVYIEEFFTLEETNSLLWGASGNWSPREIRGQGQPDYPTLGSDDINRLSQLVTQLKKLVPQLGMPLADSRFSFALARWDSGLARKRGVDQLVDHWIALESLFASGATTEIVYRISLRIAAHLGRTPNERERLYQEMRKAYGWRSKIVHGGRPAKPKDQQELAKAIAASSSCLRSALLQTLRDGEVFNDEAIEVAMLRASAPEGEALEDTR
jgi:hypothetical protein